jgi:hypothetical protein
VRKITKRQYFSGGFAEPPAWSVKNDGTPFTPPPTDVIAQAELGTGAAKQPGAQGAATVEDLRKKLIEADASTGLLRRDIFEVRDAASGQPAVCQVYIMKDEAMLGRKAIYLGYDDGVVDAEGPDYPSHIIAVSQSAWVDTDGRAELLRRSIAEHRQSSGAVQKSDTPDPDTLRPNGEKDPDIVYLDSGMPHGSISDPALPRYFAGSNSGWKIAAYHSWARHSKRNRAYALDAHKDKIYWGFQHSLIDIKSEGAKNYAAELRSRLDVIAVMEDDEFAKFSGRTFFYGISAGLGFCDVNNDFSASMHRDPNYEPNNYFYPRFARAAAIAAFVLKAPKDVMKEIVMYGGAAPVSYKGILEALKYYANCILDGNLPKELAGAVDPEILNHLYYFATHEKPIGDTKAMCRAIVERIEPFLRDARAWLTIEHSEITRGMGEFIMRLEGTRQDLDNTHTSVFVPAAAGSSSRGRDSMGQPETGGEDFRGLDTKAGGKFDKMGLKGTDLKDLGDLSVQITAIVPFRP